MVQERVELLAPCGVYCGLCSRYLAAKKPCGGCRGPAAQLAVSCQKCAIRGCVQARGAGGCLTCASWPCKKLLPLYKNYRRRYQVDLPAFVAHKKTVGKPRALAALQESHRCPACGRLFSLQDGCCLHCLKKE